MKKLLIFMMTMLLVITFTGCFFKGGDEGDVGNNNGGGEIEEGDNGNEESPEEKPAIKGVSFFMEENLFYIDEAELINGIYYATGYSPMLIKDETTVVTGYEIAFGDTDREITKEAYEYLDRLGLTSNDAIFIVYRSGKQTAVIWNSPSICSADAAKYFVGDFLTKYGFTETSVAEYLTYSIQDYKNEKEAERWAEVTESLSDEALSYLKKIYALFGEETWSWVANLYDPDIGGFYASNSARDYYGVAGHLFLPDVESTGQALSILTDGGLFSSVGGTYADILPDAVREKLGEFVYNLQDEDGYFYHPQWGKDITTAGRSRNLGASSKILAALGIQPKYKLPTDALADSGEYDDVSVILTEPFGEKSSVEACAIAALSSSVVPVAGGIHDYLRSPEAFIEYLETLDFKTDSYASGHTISSQANEIKAAGLAEVCVNYINSLQNPENGLWEDVVDYDTISGLLKISSAFHTLGGKLNYVDKAFASAISLVLSPAQPNAMTRLYNPVVAVSNMLTNVKKFGTEEELRMILDYTKSVEDELIKITYEKLLPFYRGMGSFSYYFKIFSSAEYSTSQGNVVSLNVLEGETNSTRLAMGTTRALQKILGFNIVPFFDSTDLDGFIDLISSMGSIVKAEYEDVEEIGTPPIITFDDSSEIPENVIPKMVGTNGSYCQIVEDPYSSDNKVIEFRSLPGYTDYLYVTRTSSTVADANCFVFSCDISFTDIKDVATSDIRFIMEGLYYISFNANKGTIRVSDSSNMGDYSYTNELPFTLKTGKTYNLTFKYHLVDTVAYIETYVDGVLVNVSDNFTGRSTELVGEEAAIASTKYKKVHFFAYKASDITVHIDNIFLDRIYEDYTPPKEFNVPIETVREPEEITFDNGTKLPSSVISAVNTDKGSTLEVTNDPSNELNNVLSFSTVPGHTDYLYFERSSTSSLEPNCYVFSLDLNVTRCEDVTTGDLRLVMDGLYYVTLTITNGVIVFSDNSNAAEGAASATMPFNLSVGTSYKITFKYHLVGERAYIETYVDGKLMYVSENYYGRSTLLDEEAQPAAPTVYKQAYIFGFKNADLSVTVDNVLLDRCEEKFTPPVSTKRPVGDITFDDSDEIPTDITPVVGSSGGSISIVTDEVSGDNSLLLSTTAGGAESVTVGIGEVTKRGGNVYVFETDLCFTNSTVNKVIARINLGGYYELKLRSDKAKKLHIQNMDAGTTDFLFSVRFGEWFTLRMEYYVLDDGNARVITYANGNVIEDVTIEHNGAPYSEVKLYSLKDGVFDLYIDDVFMDIIEAE